jgi:hypothetical protein
MIWDYLLWLATFGGILVPARKVGFDEGKRAKST